MRLSVLACAMAFGLVPSVQAHDLGHPPQEVSYELTQPQRLSSWLLGQGEGMSSGFWAWFTPEERARAQAEWPAVRERIIGSLNLPEQESDRHGLSRWLLAAQPQGRVPLGATQVPWLQANPVRDPMLRPGDRLMRLDTHRSVGVLNERAVCWMQHRPKAYPLDYIHDCAQGTEGLPSGQPVWVIQPDGRVRTVRQAAWAPEQMPELAPGALVWMGWPAYAMRPGMDETQRQALSQETAEWLARLWPSPQAEELPHNPNIVVFGPMHPRADPGFDPQPSASNWGMVGLLQTPTARMRAPGTLAVGYHQTSPYSWLNVTMQPLDWLEAGFRYMSVSNRRYGAEDFSGTQSAKDKSIEFKARLWSESDWRPEVALGVRDVGGTGLFGSEYLVASKRWGRLDASLGLGWGNMGARRTLGNPVSGLLGSAWDQRPEPSGSVGEAGKVNAGKMFHGRTALFGGLEYQSPWGPSFKLEYEGNSYQHEPLRNRLAQRSSLNVGLVHRMWPGVDLSLGYERGTTWSLGLTLWTDLSRTHTTKLADVQPPAVTLARPPAGHVPDWHRTLDDVQALTDWRVARLARQDDRLVLEVSDSDAPYRGPRLDKALAVLHRDAPADVARFEVHHRQAGEVLAVQSQEREAWLQSMHQPARTTAAAAQSSLAFVPAGQASEPTASLVRPEPARPRVWPSLSFIQSLGGPDAFMLYQLSAALNGEWRLPSDAVLAGRLQGRLLSNYDKFEFEGFSSLPRVRTHVRDYLTTSRVTIINLDMGKAARLSTNWSGSIYGGYLEEMFAGVGGELLYRQPGSRWALGVDVNQVRQRDFAQDFGLRDYRVKTGHVSLYWQSPWQYLDVTLQAGQYLAGDRGATLSVSRVFENGLRMGAFATRTNVSAQQFGEGAFNKGVFVSIPFDAFLTRSSRGVAQFNWVPLTRDGGAALVRPMRLMDATSWLASPAATFTPATPPDDRVIPDDRQRP